MSANPSDFGKEKDGRDGERDEEEEEKKRTNRARISCYRIVLDLFGRQNGLEDLCDGEILNSAKRWIMKGEKSETRQISHASVRLPSFPLDIKPHYSSDPSETQLTLLKYTPFSPSFPVPSSSASPVSSLPTTFPSKSIPALKCHRSLRSLTSPLPGTAPCWIRRSSMAGERALRFFLGAVGTEGVEVVGGVGWKCVEMRDLVRSC